MLLDGNSRGGANDLAIHLMKPENERVEIIEMRGFLADNLKDAFLESYAISKGTRTKKHLYSMSIDPPVGANIGDEEYINAANRTELKLKLTNQPRTIVRHWKKGEDGIVRAHAHVVWCRIDASNMKAIDLPFSKLKLRDVSRELHIEHDIPMPRGLLNYEHRDPRNFTFEQWQQSKRTKTDFRKVQSDFMDAWAISDNRATFAHALEERGYILARGDRGFVAVDYKGKIFAARQYSGVRRVEDFKKKLGDTIGLPSIEKAQEIAAIQVAERLAELRQEQAENIQLSRSYVRYQENQIESRYARQKTYQEERHSYVAAQKEIESHSRLRKGIAGLWDRFTGRRKKILLLNQAEIKALREQQNKEALALKNSHLTKLKVQHKEARVQRAKHFEAMKELREDVKRIREKPETKQRKSRRKKPASERPRRKGRSRDGPSLER